MADRRDPHPQIVSLDEWNTQLAELLEKEKAHTRAGDALAAQRRRLPMVKIEQECRLRGEVGEVTLAELFDGRPQLIIYHFMYGPDWGAGCDGCSWVADAMTHPAHLRARDTSFALVSRAPLDTLLGYRTRMGWDLPWYSSADSDFNDAMGATVEGEEHHGLSVFMRVDDAVYRTYYTTDRGIEHLGSHWTYLDLTPFGRQEFWEDSPDGWPQSEPYAWQRRHDEYEDD
jgi:predicted dithiol-disulfide oxidoreductase (DUF899 family)